MAIVIDKRNNTSFQGNDADTYLTEHGVYVDRWATTDIPRALKTAETLSPLDQEQILSCFAQPLSDLAERFGYISHDMIVLNAQSTANLEDLLKKFEQEHHHTEDEVRFIIDGEGIFSLKRGGDHFDVIVQEGDLISVPANTRHYFTLTAVRNVKAIRIFKTREGWVAIYDDPQGQGTV